MGADQNRNLEGQNVIVSGWGTTEKGDIKNHTGTLFIKELPLDGALQYICYKCVTEEACMKCFGWET